MVPVSPVQHELLAAIALTARRVLALECEDGVLAAAFKARVPDAHWTSTVLEPANLEAAKSLAADKVLRGGAESGHLPWAKWRGRFDCIVLCTGLEELERPTDTLRKLGECLASGGVVVAAVANPAHWRNVATLLQGRHLTDQRTPSACAGARQFTQQGVFDLFRAAGLEVRRMTGRQSAAPSPEMEAFEKSAAALLEMPDDDVPAMLRRLRTSHFIVRATRREAAAAAKPRLVVAVLAMAPTLADVRTRLPLEAMSTLPDVEVHYLERQGQLPQWPSNQPKVLVVQRQLVDLQGSWEQTISGLRAKGWAIVAEWDDHPDLFPPSVKENFDAAPWGSVRAADAAQTSTQPLAQVLREARGDDKVVIFDNRMLELPPERPVTSELTAAPRIGFAAVARTAEGLEMMAAIAPVLARWPQALITVVHDRAVFDAVAHPNKRFVPLLRYHEYHAELSRLDIALLPLAASLPNECKSDVKWVEAASHGIACIVSPTVYARTVESERTGLIAESPQAFALALERLLADPQLRTRLGQQARAAVAARRMLAGDVARRIEWYESLWRACAAKEPLARAG